ncbi:REP-associated tyrosine transposase [Pleionea litopenaei]|uniref:Transposase n=1 Tax=Pleionea litopenaei TaxID=3070815 RepID=A0AA51RSS4_9GAMM|nr:transposase [Pleionea sp. HL-JVS1]WMS86855.1 transposase [Pleionea sp. HL-JVS1]
MHYRRTRVKGASYFFTVNLADRDGTTFVDFIDHLQEAFRQVKERHPFENNGIVILPEHIHTIWTMPLDDCNYSMRWRLIKSAFSRSLPKTERISQSRKSKAERGVWQRRFWEHKIRNEIDYARHIDYMYFNPVRHGYVERVQDWPHSSFHRDVRNKVYPIDWGGGVDITINAGERN